MITVSTTTYFLSMVFIFIGLITLAVAAIKFKTCAKFLACLLLSGGTFGFILISFAIIKDSCIYFFHPAQINLIQPRTFTGAALVCSLLFAMGLRGVFGLSLKEIAASKSTISHLIYIGLSGFLFLYMDYLVLLFYTFCFPSRTAESPHFIFLFSNAFGFYLFFRLLINNWYTEHLSYT